MAFVGGDVFVFIFIASKEEASCFKEALLTARTSSCCKRAVVFVDDVDVDVVVFVTSQRGNILLQRRRHVISQFSAANFSLPSLL